MAAASGKKMAKVFYSVGSHVDKQTKVQCPIKGKRQRRGEVLPIAS